MRFKIYDSAWLANYRMLELLFETRGDFYLYGIESKKKTDINLYTSFVG